MLILKNTTGTDIVLDVSGLTIPASGQLTIDPSRYHFFQKSDSTTETDPIITSGDLVVNDGVRDLTASQGKRYLLFREALGIPFRSDPDRINGFASKDVQDAIEEVDAKVTGKPRAIVTYSYNGNASNRWLELAHSISSDTSPYVAPENCKIKALSVSVRTSTTASAQVYVNGISKHTLTITSSTQAIASNLNIIVLAGDKVSVKVTSGSMSEPIFTTSLEIDL